jgi:hypothetical protein
MMAKKPADRPSAMADVAVQLRQMRLFDRDPQPPVAEGDAGSN